MFEELTPEMRFNYGNAISSKDDTPPCIRRRTALDENPNLFDDYQYTDADKEWFFRSIADENDTCTCEPGNPGVVWSRVLKEMGPWDKQEWFTRTEDSRQRDIGFFLEEAAYDAARYERMMTTRYGGM